MVSLNPNLTEAIAAVKSNVVVCDRSHWGRIEVRDNDRLRFLHNQSTNDLQTIPPGKGCETVFVTSTARMIDLATAYITDDAVLLIVSPQRHEYLLQWLDKYIFFADQVELIDKNPDTALFTLIGSHSDEIIRKLGGSEIIGQPEHSHILVNNNIRIAVGTGLALPGYNLIVPTNEKANIWEKIINAGATTIDDNTWESLRIIQGRPVPDRELTEDYNPLEVGLWQTVSFSKGCYIGQETIARLNTYKGVKTYLWGIKLNESVPLDSDIYLSEENLSEENQNPENQNKGKIGKLTSLTPTPEGYFGLGYIRSKVGGVGLKIKIENALGEVVAVPFVSHEYPE